MSDLVLRLRSRAWEYRFHRRYRDEAANEIERLQRECEAKQAQIDALMLEHSPDEMTQEQRFSWTKNQRASPEPLSVQSQDAQRYQAHVEMEKASRNLPADAADSPAVVAESPGTLIAELEKLLATLRDSSEDYATRVGIAKATLEHLIAEAKKS